MIQNKTCTLIFKYKHISSSHQWKGLLASWTTAEQILSDFTATKSQTAPQFSSVQIYSCLRRAIDIAASAYKYKNVKNT